MPSTRRRAVLAQPLGRQAYRRTPCRSTGNGRFGVRLTMANRGLHYPVNSDPARLFPGRIGLLSTVSAPWSRFMKKYRFDRAIKLMASGVVLLQAGGCFGFDEFFQLVDTVLLGITAAGAIAIIQNI